MIVEEIPDIPKCMSTQHPDNIHLPFFTRSPDFGGEDEVEEAYYTYSHLGCREQMWDCEGKEVDNFVAKNSSPGIPNSSQTTSSDATSS